MYIISGGSGEKQCPHDGTVDECLSAKVWLMTCVLQWHSMRTVTAPHAVSTKGSTHIRQVPGEQFKPNDFSDDAPESAETGRRRFMAGRYWAASSSADWSEEKCKRCQDMGSNAVNMKVKTALICKTMGAHRRGCEQKFHRVDVCEPPDWKGCARVPSRVQAIDKRSCYKGRSRQNAQQS